MVVRSNIVTLAHSSENDTLIRRNVRPKLRKRIRRKCARSGWQNARTGICILEPIRSTAAARVHPSAATCWADFFESGNSRDMHGFADKLASAETPVP